MHTLLAVTAILVAAAITPGPNNFIVLAAGARGGLMSAAAPIAGVILGGLTLLTLCWGGVAAVLESEPLLRPALTLLGATYLIWLGSGQIRATCGPTRTRNHRSPADELPRTWMGVAAFQLLNPKAWVLLLTATAAMSREFNGVQGFVALATIYVVRSGLSLTVWAMAGSAISRLTGRDHSGRWLGRAMGGLLVASAVMLAVGAF